MEAIVGMHMKASIRPALKRLSPVGRLNVFCSHGATITMPMKPITTEGNAAISSITGLRMRAAQAGTAQCRAAAVSTPSGTADDSGEDGGRKRANDHGAEAENGRLIRRIPVRREEEIPDGNVLEDRESLRKQEEHDGRECEHAHARHAA